MTYRCIIPLSCCLALLLSSCVRIRPVGKPVRASYNVEEEEGWISKHIPGIGALSRLIPPPSDARKEWDKRQKRQTGQFGSDHETGF